MHAPTHDIMSVPGTSSRRTMIIGTVVMLHILIVYALISGMAAQIVKYVPRDILVVDTHTKSTPQPPPPPTPVLEHPQPRIADVPIPVIDAVPDQTSPIQVQPTPANNTPAQPDTGAAGISSTHSTPPYPALARVAAHQGTVLLQIVVSAGGSVSSANVIQSSGFPELDQAAVTWVTAHWKYKPALQNGQAVPSQTQAAVKFDLRQARS